MARRSKAVAGFTFAFGIEELDARLRAMPTSLQKKGVRKATRRAAKLVLEDAIKMVPVKSGALKKSLAVRARKRTRAKHRIHDVAHLVVQKGALFSGRQFYGGFLEYGTKERISWKGKRGAIKEATFWYLRPALYRKKHEKFFVFVQELTNWLATV